MGWQVRAQRRGELRRGAIRTEDLRAGQLDLAQGKHSPAAIALLQLLQRHACLAIHQARQCGTERRLAAKSTHAMACG